MTTKQIRRILVAIGDVTRGKKRVTQSRCPHRGPGYLLKRNLREVFGRARRDEALDHPTPSGKQMNAHTGNVALLHTL